MIDDVDAAVVGLLTARLAAGVEVTVGPPPPAGNRGRAVSLLLHDVTEDITRRQDDPEPVRDTGGRMLSRQTPPRRFHLSYLVTASAPDVAAEHRLLSEALAVLAAYNRVPTEYVGGGVGALGVPLIMSVWPRRLEGPLSPITDIWSSFGIPLRPSIDLRVTSPLIPLVIEEVGPPVVERVIDLDDRTGGAHEALREPAEVVTRRRAILSEGGPARPPRDGRR